MLGGGRASAGPGPRSLGLRAGRAVPCCSPVVGAVPAPFLRGRGEDPQPLAVPAPQPASEPRTRAPSAPPRSLLKLAGPGWRRDVCVPVHTGRSKTRAPHDGSHSEISLPCDRQQPCPGRGQSPRIKVLGTQQSVASSCAKGASSVPLLRKQEWGGGAGLQHSGMP